MSESNKVVDENLIQELETSLTDKLLSSLEQKEITMVQMKEASAFILDNIHNIRDYSHLVVFLDNLQQRWHIFKDIFNIYKHKFHKEQEEVVMDKLRNYIGNFQH